MSDSAPKAPPRPQPVFFANSDNSNTQIERPGRSIESSEGERSGVEISKPSNVIPHRPPVKEAAAADGSKKVSISYLMRALLKYNASDLHLKMDRPPLFRIDGKLVPAKMPDLNKEDVERIILSLLNDRQKMELDKHRQVDFSFSMEGNRRARCNIYFQKNSMAASIRMVPASVNTLEELKLPHEVLKDLCARPRGIIFVTGSTGSGKSTTLASMIRHINETRSVHILSFEDPIEFVHPDMKAAISQREVGSDVYSMKEGLIAGLRQDPDIIMIGEVRDAETIQAALTAAETGHLVVTTLHTNDAKSTISRVVDVFPIEVRNFIRIQIASSLVGVIAQQLLPKADGSGMIPACEVMVKSPTIENYILKNELESIPEVIASSNTYYKMQSMNQALEKLAADGVVTVEEALKASNNPDDLKMILSGVTREEGYSAKKSKP